MADDSNKKEPKFSDEYNDFSWQRAMFSSYRDETKKKIQNLKNVLKTEQEIDDTLRKQILHLEKINKYQKEDLEGKQEILESEIKRTKEQLTQLEVAKNLNTSRKEQREIMAAMEVLQEDILFQEKQLQKIKEAQDKKDTIKQKAQQQLEKNKKILLDKENAKLAVEQKILEKQLELKKQGKDVTTDKELQSLQMHLKDLEEEISDAKSNRNKSFLAAVGTGGDAKDIASIAFGANSPLTNALGMLSKGMDKIVNSLDTTVSDAMSSISANMGKVNARLYGSPVLGDNKAFGKLIDTATKNTTAFMSNKKYFENITRLVGEGVAFNVEERAAIMTLSEKMVTTFDALNPTLTRLVRVQQTDMTYSQLGAESYLNETLNSMFGDTSYLNNLYDSVASAIFDASTQLDVNNSTAFQYAVQKWLGSMYSVGVSDSAITSIASGINLLGTGNVESLTSNSTLNTLLAMSAKYAGLTYSELLVQGVDAHDANKLLKGMTEYLRDINDDMGNQVTKNAMANILGISVADLRAIANLTDTDISGLASVGIDYGSAISQANKQADFASSMARTSVAESIDNMLDNMLYQWGMNIAYGNGDEADATNYLAYKGGKVIAGLGKGLGENVIGSIIGGVGSAIALLPMILSFTDVMGTVAESLGSGTFNDATKLFTLYDNYSMTSRGKTPGKLTTGVSTGVTESLISGGIPVDMNTSYDGSIPANQYTDNNFQQSAETIAQTQSQVSNSEQTISGKSVADLYEQLIDKKFAIRVKVDGFTDKGRDAMISTLESATIKTDIIDNDITSIISGIRRY